MTIEFSDDDDEDEVKDVGGGNNRVNAFEPDLSQFDLGSPTVDEDSPPEPWEAPPAAVRLSPEKSKWPAAASDGSSSSSGPTEVSPVLGRPASSHQLLLTKIRSNQPAR